MPDLYFHPNLSDFISPGPFTLGDGDEVISYARGWWDKATEQEITALGFVEYAPPEPEPPTLEERKAQLVAAAYARCQAVITDGFVSTALGAQHTYPSQLTDQLNLMGSVTESLLPGLAETWTTVFWCADANGLWLMRDHDAAQIQQAGRDGKAHVLSCQMHLDGLVHALTAAADGEALDLIDIEAGWPA